MDREAWKLLSLEHAIRIQTKLRPKVIQKGPKSTEDFEKVGGDDIAYWNIGEEE